MISNVRKINLKWYILIMVLGLNILLYNVVMKDEISRMKKHRENIKRILTHDNLIKFILIWSNKDEIWSSLYKDRFGFIRHKCKYTNCYITENKKLLQEDYTIFDTILFDAKAIALEYNDKDLPKERGPKQKYVLTSLDPAADYPVCNDIFDNYFNNTFTYRLDSDIVWNYFDVYNMKGNIIGPRNNMEWINKSSFVSKTITNIVKTKTMPVVWIASNCVTSSKREVLVSQLKNHLFSYGIVLDIVGECGNLECRKTLAEDKCMDILRNYYFYLALESSVAEDYVTEKVLTAFMYDVVPVVYGGANYTKFLPPNSYIDAGKLGAKATAKVISYMVNNLAAYKEYFEWRNHYVYKISKNYICDLCRLANVNLKSNNNYTFLRKWWNPEYEKLCINTTEETTLNFLL